MRRCLSVLACLLVSIGCEAGGNELDVDVRTDVVAGTEFARVETEVSAVTSGGGPSSTTTYRLDARVGADWFSGRRAAEHPVSAPGSFRVRVALLDAEGAVVVEREVIAAAASGRTVAVVVLARGCRGVTCAEGLTCAGGECVDPGCVGDACVGVCERDAQCSAAVECAVGRCVEGACLTQALDARCSAGQWCSPERGCIALPGVGDAGTPPRDAPRPLDLPWSLSAPSTPSGWATVLF